MNKSLDPGPPLTGPRGRRSCRIPSKCPHGPLSKSAPPRHWPGACGYRRWRASDSKRFRRNHSQITSSRLATKLLCDLPVEPAWCSQGAATKKLAMFISRLLAVFRGIAGMGFQVGATACSSIPKGLAETRDTVLNCVRHSIENRLTVCMALARGCQF